MLNKNPLKGAIGYCRVSTRKQGEKDSSIPAQRADLSERAAADGFQLVRWFGEEQSGKTIDERLEMVKLIEWARKNKGQVKRLYVRDYKRFSRSQEDMFILFRELRKAGVEVVAISNPLTEDDAVNALLIGVYSGVGQMERMIYGRNVRSSQRNALCRGYWPFNRVPLALRRQRTTNHRGAHRFVLVINEEEAAVVRRIYTLYISGDGYKRIAAQFTKERVLGRTWNHRFIGRLIRNPVYRGAAAMNGSVLLEGAFPAVVSRETWRKAEAMRKARHRAPREVGRLNTGQNGVFVPVLRCGVCGGPMRVNRGGSERSGWKFYYACSRRFDDKESCTGLTARVDQLDPLLLDHIEDEVLTPENVRTVIEESVERLRATGGADAAAAREEIEERIADASAKLRKLAQAIADDTMAHEDVRSLSADLRSARDYAREELGALPPPRPIPSADEVDMEAFRRAIISRWRDKDTAVQRRALKSMIDEVVLSPGEALVRYSWRPESAEYTHQAPPGPP